MLVTALVNAKELMFFANMYIMPVLRGFMLFEDIFIARPLRCENTIVLY